MRFNHFRPSKFLCFFFSFTLFSATCAATAGGLDTIQRDYPPGDSGMESKACCSLVRVEEKFLQTQALSLNGFGGNQEIVLPGDPLSSDSFHWEDNDSTVVNTDSLMIASMEEIARNLEGIRTELSRMRLLAIGVLVAGTFVFLVGYSLNSME